MRKKNKSKSQFQRVGSVAETVLTAPTMSQETRILLGEVTVITTVLITILQKGMVALITDNIDLCKLKKAVGICNGLFRFLVA